MHSCGPGAMAASRIESDPTLTVLAGGRNTKHGRSRVPFSRVDSILLCPRRTPGMPRLCSGNQAQPAKKRIHADQTSTGFGGLEVTTDARWTVFPVETKMPGMHLDGLSPLVSFLRRVNFDIPLVCLSCGHGWSRRGVFDLMRQSINELNAKCCIS